MRFPEFPIIHVFDSFPDLRLAAVLVPAGPQVTVIETEHLRREPRGNMHAVGDVPDGDRLFRLAGIEPRPHRARDFAVQRRYGVGAPRKFQAQHGHTKLFVRGCRILAPQRHQPFVGKTERIPQRPKMLLDQAGVEAVVARGNGSVRGKGHFAAHARHRLIEIQALFLHAAANRFEHRKSAVPFVQVQNAGRDSHRFQGAEASTPKQQFLADSNAAIAAIQPRSELAILRRVSFDVRIEQEQIAASHLHAPHFRADRAAARLNLHGDRFALGADGRFHGHVADIGLKVFFLLPAILVQALPEIALAVKQSDPNQGNAQIGGALDVVPGENAQTPRNRREWIRAIRIPRRNRRRGEAAERRRAALPRCGPPRDIPAGGGRRS